VSYAVFREPWDGLTCTTSCSFYSDPHPSTPVLSPLLWTNATTFRDRPGRGRWVYRVAAAVAPSVPAVPDTAVLSGNSPVPSDYLSISRRAEATGTGAAAPLSPRRDLRTSIAANVGAVHPGQEVDFSLTAADTATDRGYGGVVLTIELPPGMHLLGTPYHERGTGCTGTRTIRCSLDDLSPLATTLVRFNVSVTQRGPQTVRAHLSAIGARDEPPVTFTVSSS
jgi:hypothetical protein